MPVTVLIHAELIEGPKLSWWAESPDVPGFSAAAETLVELRGLTSQTLRDLAEDRGEDPETVEIRWEMLPPEPASQGADVGPTGDGSTPVTIGHRITEYSAVA